MAVVCCVVYCVCCSGHPHLPLLNKGGGGAGWGLYLDPFARLTPNNQPLDIIL